MALDLSTVQASRGRVHWPGGKHMQIAGQALFDFDLRSITLSFFLSFGEFYRENLFSLDKMSKKIVC
jgi:hypothetical protein